MLALKKKKPAWPLGSVIWTALPKASKVVRVTPPRASVLRVTRPSASNCCVVVYCASSAAWSAALSPAAVADLPIDCRVACAQALSDSASSTPRGSMICRRLPSPSST
ncbi:hypothetical protein GALL_524810 [mine drainage metagenome]|uniref:Uncharacterized protein n=1 Tax=mine drainage metagenome TaxID=410659 RepID=A0A1J5PEK9_9ZZZZ